MINYGGFRTVCCHRTAAIGGLALGVASLGYGVAKDISNSNKASDIEKRLKTPVDVIPPEFYQNREIARQMAQIGIPTQQYNNDLNNINQTQAGALAAVGRSANPGSAVSSIVRHGDEAKNTLDAEDAAARATNQRYFIQQNAALGARKDQQEQTNLFDPYTRDFNQMQAYRGAADQTTGNIINSAGSLANTMLKYKNQYPGLYGGISAVPAGTEDIAGNMAIPQEYWGMMGGGQ